MINIEYIPDNSKAEQVFNRLVYGLKDTNGDYIQQGMPDTLFFDKRRKLVPFKENGAIFRITTKDDPEKAIYFCILDNINGRFYKGESIIIKDTVDYIKPDVWCNVSNAKMDSLSILSPDAVLDESYNNFTITGQDSKATATIKSISKGVSTYHPHTLIVIPTDIKKPTVEQTYFRQFVPKQETTYLMGIKLGKGWNNVSIVNETTGEKKEIVINCRYYATIMQSVADEIYRWIRDPIDRERANIYHYLSTRLCEMYLTYRDLIPNIDTIQRLGLILSVKSFVNFPARNASVESLATAISGNTPFIAPQQVNNNFLPAIYDLFNIAQDFAGNDLNLWIRNKQLIRWLTFIKYINNVPFYDLNSVSENDVSLYRVYPFFSYYIPVELLSFTLCPRCGYNNPIYFSPCPECAYDGTGKQGIIREIFLKFKEGENATINGHTAKVVKVYEHGLSISSPSGLIAKHYIIEGQESKARGKITENFISNHDWNYPVIDNWQEKCLSKKLEWHQFDFSNNPLNDDWRILNCWADVVGSLVCKGISRFAICAAFNPWDKYVKNLLSFEQTPEEEAYDRTHQLEIDDETLTYSRHKDYPTKIGDGGSILNILTYKGSPEPNIYKSLNTDAYTPLTGFVASKTALTPNNFGNLVYNYLGDVMIAVIYNNIFGYIKYISTDWDIVIKRPNGNSLKWISNMPQNPVTYLPELSACKGASCNILDQGVEWTHLEAPITTLGTNWIVETTDVPGAYFYGTPTYGLSPFAVNFTDESVGVIDMWYWSFGDGGYSTDQNPIHNYTSAGKYSVTLIVSGPFGISIRTKQDYIHVVLSPE